MEKPQSESPKVEFEPEVDQEEINAAKKEIKGKSELEIARVLARERKEKGVYATLAKTDPLTTLLNRRGINEEFRRVTGALERVGWKKGEYENFRFYSVLMFDLVGLHKINKTQGEPEGDKVLVETANILKESAKRAGDLVGRWGGDEFVIVSVNTNQEDAMKLIQQIQERFPPGRLFNVAVGFFDKKDKLEETLDQTSAYIEDAKSMGPKDETGRSTGFGIVIVNK